MDKIFKSDKWMGWIALVTMIVVVAYVVDQYWTKDMFGLVKKTA